jgi:probable HAF family extracellular repeat protein
VANNNRGQTVGLYADSDGGLHGFRHERDGSSTIIDVPGAQTTVIYDINDQGQMVGIYIDAGAIPEPNGLYPRGSQHAFVWDNGVVTVVDPPTTVYAPNAHGINNRGQIVGVYVDADLEQHGYLLDHGTYSPIEPPGSSENKAFGINDRGQVVGVYLDAGAVPGADGLYPPGTLHGYLWDGDGYTTLDPPGSRGTFATKINDRGQIVGEYEAAEGTRRAFIHSSGSYTPIDAPGDRPSTIATDVNDRGDIVIPAAGTVGLLDIVA